MSEDIAALIERLIQAAVDYENATGIYSAGARRELNDARAAIEGAFAVPVPEEIAGLLKHVETSDHPIVNRLAAVLERQAREITWREEQQSRHEEIRSGHLARCLEAEARIAELEAELDGWKEKAFLQQQRANDLLDKGK